MSDLTALSGFCPDSFAPGHAKRASGPLGEEAAWQAVCARDRGADGRLIFAVKSTGIYCRPSCPARRPARRHTEFFTSPEQASAAGYRACLRCHPDDAPREAVAIARAIALMQDAATRLPLADLAAACGYSAAHFQRLFRRATGLSPAAYGRALRLDRAEQALGQGASVTEAIYAAGY
ncbi:MAG TPA: Ada metal-binding domain-containing protein, partial [Novosphingobium sp.]|nr:Ada metal-binding domain-containing protein [Novosphingobium sp.]